MEPTESNRLPSSGLFLGALAGFVAWVVFALAASYLSAPETTGSPLFIGLLFFGPFFGPGLVVGLVAHAALARAAWLPRLTWLLFALIYLPALALGTLVISTLASWLPPSLPVNWQPAVAPVHALVTLAFWLLGARAALKAILKQPAPVAESAGRQWLFIAGQAALAVFVAASWLPGIATLMLGAAAGVSAMTVLAVYGTGRRSPEHRSPAFLLALWALPAATLVGAVAVIALDI